MHHLIHRRNFLRNSSLAGLGLAVAAATRGAEPATPPAVAPAARTGIGPNGTLRVAVIGTNGRGQAHIECLTRIPGTEVVVICDVDDRAVASGLKSVNRRQKTPARGMKDFRKVLEDAAVDAVTIATPDHWHAPMAILALKAGKHVYVEKPCSHNPREGELLEQAVAASGRVLQMGNQRRSFPRLQHAIARIHEGVIGRPYFARAWYNNGRGSIGHGTPTTPPAWLDYDLWQGPAPRRPFRSNLIHYNWHWFWHYGTGEALNNGTHEVDVCRWALGVDWPSRVVSHGGRYQFDDDWETPDTQVIGWDYAGGKSISWEGRSCNSFPTEKLDRGVMIHGTAGSALLDGNNYTFYDSKGKPMETAHEESAADPTNTISASGIGLDQLHFADFVAAIRTGKLNNSPIAEGHKSVAMLHLGNIAWRVGRELHCDPANGRVQDDPGAMKLWGRDYEPGWEPKV